MERRGQCLCGAITITAKQPADCVGACHCGMCRRWGGGPLLVVDCGTDIEIDGGSEVSIFDSSQWAARGFCSKCGTHLFYRLKETQQLFIPVGLFADDAALKFDHQVFIDEKPDWYQFANDTENMTGAELFAKFGAAQ